MNSWLSGAQFAARHPINGDEGLAGNGASNTSFTILAQSARRTSRESVQTMASPETFIGRQRKSALAVLLAATAAFPLLTVSPSHAEDVINVYLDQAKIIELPDKTATVILGNPIIADVTMLKRNNKVVLTGKGFGETNLIALDASGTALGESVIRVTSASHDLVVQRGMDRESYTCAPRCQPTISLGDTPKFTSDLSGQIQARNALSGGGGGH
jgi:hypothetical protein